MQPKIFAVTTPTQVWNLIYNIGGLWQVLDTAKDAPVPLTAEYFDYDALEAVRKNIPGDYPPSLEWQVTKETLAAFQQEFNPVAA